MFQIGLIDLKFRGTLAALKQSTIGHKKSFSFVSFLDFASYYKFSVAFEHQTLNWG